MSSTLELEDYKKVVNEFLEKSADLGDGWSRKAIKEEDGYSYLVKTIRKMENLDKGNLNSDDNQTDFSEVNDSIVTYEYHIVYSLSYAVPVMYFTAWKEDGSTLLLEEIWSRVPKYYQDQLKNQRWTMLSQQEHPILGRPFFTIHPCHTSELMKNVLSVAEKQESFNYLVSWLSIVGPIVGLEVSPYYITKG
ncbi:ubiquitin-like-conjugating enzyme ATG10 isoform X2 [Centruroides sculpturatus]|uniref:ubiquitin-like-conjugating enzyme ATG10 isoform X2 n=1 Tax=Centruroides sculpturatus TaxID=218467 RepID=UPI000C6ECEF6|nr:ubiquitin-like-conjugating enzyme ATG10 isoform X2 [Centruroides sculpturatus]